jgi:hypothetical protein
MTTCEQRDGFLGKWLTEDERTAFEAHVANCPDCRQFVREQGRLDDLLARANAALVPVPAPLMDQIDHRLRQVRRRRVAAWVSGLAAAALLVCAVGAWLLPQREKEDEPVRHPLAVLPAPPREATRDPRSLVEVTFQPPSDVIAIPQKTDNPLVTIIWVYPTIKTVQEASPAPTESFQPQERNGI